MLFSDPVFFAFFAVYFVLHLLLPVRWRLWLVIVGSTVFYGWWRPAYVELPYILTVTAWAGTLWLSTAKEESVRRLRFAATIVLVFLPLVIVKYAYFVANDVLGLKGVVDTDQLRWPLPLGISFITFTLSAYVIDVYRGQYQAERSLPLVLSYVLFFPHLIAGPILRPHELMPQLRHMRDALGARFLLGVAIFTLGLVKKLVFADSIAAAVDRVYAGHGGDSGWEYLLAAYGFSAQIYCDFSGYTDMAIGLAYLLRIRLPTNFLRPYAASSVIHFWRQWHITLSHWLRDYLYIPLGGNRGGRAPQFRNIVITMMLGGLWHGANWTFLIWGLLHGLALGATHMLRSPMRSFGIVLPGWIAVLLTFHFVTFAWIFFRASDTKTVQNFIGGLVHGSWRDPIFTLQQNAFVILLLVVFFALHRFDRHALLRICVRRANRLITIAAIAFFWMLTIAISQGSSAKFIYFDF
jgi:alginate O-acetyltransferase complex protein AlgI